MYCHKRNHWAKVCLKKKKDKRPKPKTIHSVDGAEEEEELSVYIDTITSGKDQPDTAYANVVTNTGDQIRFKLDTGAQANVILSSLYTRLKEKPPLGPSTSKLFGYSGKQLIVKGSITLDCSYKGHTYTVAFHILDTSSSSQPILGQQACLQLKIIKMVLSVDSNTPMTRDSVIKDYSQLFTGLGELEGEVTICLKEGATPVVHPARRVPHAIKGKLKEELDKMEETGVTEKVTIPMDWVNLIMVEKSNGKL